jgi:glyoxylase-like metal-dependent hydrolase (beta-lactamase superfamily II)/rhodanese-related sulfurtransferase
MLFRQLFDARSWTYTYLLADEATKEAVIIDPVFEQHLRDSALIQELGLTLKYTLETHVHADHVTGSWLLKDRFGAKIGVAAVGEAENVDVGLKDGDKLEFGKHNVEVRATPGHTNGCMTFVTSDLKRAFTGDALLIRGAGRTDFQQGDAATLFRSVKEKIFSLPDDCAIYPGHDYSGRTSSSVAEERAHNPRIGGDANEGDFVGYMDNLNLPHPKQIAVAVPANMKAGKPDSGESTPTEPDWGPVHHTYAGIPEVAPEWVSDHRDELTLVDVREANEWDGELGHVDGAMHIPLADVDKRMAEIPKDKPVIMICRSGRRSARSTQMLEKAGYEKVANLPGGMIRWRALSLP